MRVSRQAIIVLTARIFKISSNGLNLNKSISMINMRYGTKFTKKFKDYWEIKAVCVFLGEKCGEPISGYPKPSQIKEKTPKNKKVDKAFVKTDNFLRSWEWTALIYKALKKYSRACMCCGSTERPCVDHIKPRSKYPELALTFDNLQILCNLCNKGKSNTDETDWRPNP